MASNLIEYMRSIHAEISADKKSIIYDVLNPEPKHKKQIIQSHKVKLRSDRIYTNGKNLIKLYEDKSGSLSQCEKEICSKNNLGVFYSKLNNVLQQKKKINELNKNMPEKTSENIVPKLNFNEEEYYGKYVEMNEMYQTFLNMKGMPSMYLSGIKKIDYKLYLEIFDHFHNIAQGAKKTSYTRYCRSILEYLSNFYAEKFPMHPTQAILKEIREDFEEKWDKKAVAGWQKKWPEEVFQRHPFKSTVRVEDKALYGKGGEHFGLDMVVKEEKETRECESCGKSFKNTVWSSHILGKKHKKNVESMIKKDSVKKETAFGMKVKNESLNLEEPKESDPKKQSAYLEFAIKVFKTLLSDVFEETCYFIEKKLTRSYAEIIKEREERDKEDEEDEEVPEDVISSDQSLYDGGVYNPKKIPLGWDGKPIPYWLYKFHGLNIAYKCEICGGTNYYGPRAFQQHFKEWKHAHGMKALGLPNTKHFHNVTKIEEAEELYRKLKERKLIEMFNPNLEEEFEDNDGNVYGKQTYDALKRQRVI